MKASLITLRSIQKSACRGQCPCDLHSGTACRQALPESHSQGYVHLTWFFCMADCSPRRVREPLLGSLFRSFRLATEQLGIHSGSGDGQQGFARRVAMYSRERTHKLKALDSFWSVGPSSVNKGPSHFPCQTNRSEATNSPSTFGRCTRYREGIWRA